MNRRFIITILILFFSSLVLSTILIFYFNNDKDIKQESANLPSNFQEQIIKDKEIIPKDINMLFVGDTMLGRNVEVLSKEDNNYPFLNIKELFKENFDIIYSNLEGNIMDPHYKTKNGSTVFSFPKYSVDVLKQNNINLVSLSNNHTQDYGADGYKQTQDFLKDKKINYFGDYYNKENIYFKKNIDGKDFIFFGINMINKSFEKNLSDNKKMVIDNLKKIKEENPDAKIFIFPHWGNEYKIKSNKIQQEFAHELIDNGADLIIGAHPHVTQEYEIYKDKYIFYSLGNFIFDQYFSTNTQEMIGIKLNINNDNEFKFEIVPIKSINSQPEIITEEKDKQEFLNKYNLNLKK